MIQIDDIFVTNDFQFFSYADDDNLYLVTKPDNENYAYSHGGDMYRRACEKIEGYKDAIMQPD